MAQVSAAGSQTIFKMSSPWLTMKPKVAPIALNTGSFMASPLKTSGLKRSGPSCRLAFGAKSSSGRGRFKAR